MPKTKTPKTPTLVGTICLYGARHCGAGWLASHAGGMLGDGEPVKERTFTTAIWQAAEALRAAGVDGLVAIHDAGGERCAVYPVSRIPAYGNFTWQVAGPAVVISAEAILAAAES